MKHCILFLTLLFCMALGSPAQAKVIGDFNSDGNLTIADAIAFIRHLIGLDTLAEVGQEITSGTTEFLLFRDIYGNVEFEADGNYPPPDTLDNFDDALIAVTLRFGQDMDIFLEDEVYGYYITVDQNPVNYQFIFVPGGYYWLEAEFTNLDTCYYSNTENFYHQDTLDTVIGLQPTLLGVDQGCFSIILSGEGHDECVQVNPEFWVRRDVYERFYKGKPGIRDLSARENNSSYTIFKKRKRRR